MQQLSAELKVDGRELPCTLVFHISKTTATKLKIAGSSSWHTSGGPSPRYEMWIVGEPSDYIYVGLALRILEHQFGLEIEDSERTRIVQTVQLRLAAITNVQASPKEGSRRKHLSRPN